MSGNFGASNLEIGIVARIFFGTSILMRLFTSRLAARTGRKVLLVMAMLVCLLTMLGYAIAASLLLIIAFRMIQGLSFGASTTLYGAAVADLVPLRRMGEGMGIFGLGMTIAGALGPFLGAAATTMADFRWVFLVAGALVLVSIVLTVSSNTGGSCEPKTDRVGLKGYFRDFIESRAIYPAIYMLLIGLSMGGLYTYIVLYGEEIGVAEISLYFLVNAAAEFLVRIACGKLYDKHGMYIVVIPGAISGILACVVLSVADSLTMIIVASILIGITFGTIFPVAEAIAMKSVAPSRRVAATGTVYNFLDIGMGFGPLIFGAIAQFSSYSFTFLMSGLIFVAMLVLALLTRLFKWRDREGLPLSTNNEQLTTNS